ncbi:peptidoglycan/LPS O-acetylase OafA/YrhL [Kitasatospora sp. SolWspMP-SS2h]|uniref:acyltransferase family protein n=1 Tax=Kitasatospora sp. SolWspMP-SS2h TaxID=1305729 RepID=UPI000DBF50E4|nr:acyltransferase family protein [Kitasatospora sp. SolWspMP-SS2h]RAJ38885.1 peptidoglycan/LPS O-acetylase OafA/YrhL [Kitasatospora sp. SolWspMP-SS2h]
MSSYQQPVHGDLATEVRVGPRAGGGGSALPSGGRRGARRKEHGGKSFRPDIEGLRAVAVLLVLAFHAAPKYVSGGFVGVDVFFVISGFLITSLLVHEIARTGRLSLAGFYARRAKRLLPAACLTLLAAAALTYLCLPVTQRSTFGGDIVAAAAYFVNWRLADRSVDYLAADILPSPVQHFWSLAVEEQFYLIWPVLIVLALWLAPKVRWSLSRMLGVVIALVAGASLAYSVVHTALSPEAAFFVTPTRLWELAVGAIIALAAPHLAVFGRGAGAAFATVGLLMILGGGYFLDGTFAWPGSWALLPTLGAAAVLAGGINGPSGAGSLLALRPLVWIGGISYSLYLWHWPLLVAAQAEWGDGTKVSALAVLVSVVPAWLSHKLVENPIRFSAALARPFKAVWAVGLPFTALAVACGLLLTTLSSGAEDGGPVAGAAALTGMSAQQQADLWKVNSSPTVKPDPLNALADVPEAYGKGCQANQDTTNVSSCDFGDTTASTVVVMAGDSKMLQWQPALDTIGKAHGIHVVTVTKSTCAFADTTAVLNDKPYKSCVEWNRKAMAKILALHPALVLTSQNAAVALPDASASGPGDVPPMRGGMERTWTQLQKAGIPVTVVLNNVNGVPSPVYECVANHRSKLSACSFDSPDYRTADLQTDLAKALGAGVIDLNPMICPGGHCPAVIGSALIYRDGSHVTATYVKTLAPALQEQLEREFARNRIAWK